MRALTNRDPTTQPDATVGEALNAEVTALLARHGLTMTDLATQWAADGTLPHRPSGPEPIPAEVLAESDMRRALAHRDVAEVFRLLQRHGISQRRIAAIVGISQSEVSEILGNGRGPGRRVASVDVLTRIIDGLSVPASWAGLGYDETSLTYRDTPDNQPRPSAPRPIPTASDRTGIPSRRHDHGRPAYTGS